MTMMMMMRMMMRGGGGLKEYDDGNDFSKFQLQQSLDCGFKIGLIKIASPSVCVAIQ